MTCEKINYLEKDTLYYMINKIGYLLEVKNENKCEFVSDIGYIKRNGYTNEIENSHGYDAHITAAQHICDFLDLKFSVSTVKKENEFVFGKPDVIEHKQIRIIVPNIEKALATFKNNQYKQICNLGDTILKSKICEKEIFILIKKRITEELEQTLTRRFSLFEFEVDFTEIRIGKQRIVDFAKEGYERIPSYKERDSLAALILLHVFDILNENVRIKRVNEVKLTYDSFYDDGMYTQERGYSVGKVDFQYTEEEKIITENNIKKWI